MKATYILRDNTGVAIDKIVVGDLYILATTRKPNINQITHEDKPYDRYFFYEHDNPPVREYISAEGWQEFREDLRREGYKIRTFDYEYKSEFLEKLP